MLRMYRPGSQWCWIFSETFVIVPGASSVAWASGATFDTVRTVEGLQSSELQALLDQEYNCAFFVQRVYSRSGAKRLLSNLEAYAQQSDTGE